MYNCPSLLSELQTEVRPDVGTGTEQKRRTKSSGLLNLPGPRWREP